MDADVLRMVLIAVRSFSRHTYLPELRRFTYSHSNDKADINGNCFKL